ncbi:MAG: glycosyltransferase [Synergistaceae bacterium]|jgi:GT2 family glycosyltransferase|nr:glycosyltransferase [Synergistaceae bacterium]
MANENVIILNTDDMTAPVLDGTMWGNRLSAYSQYEEQGVPLCSVYVQAYNRLEKTRYAVECVLRYTRGIDYELILADNGSADGTFEYFQSVPFDKKKIIRATKNFPAAITNEIYKLCGGKYIVSLANDLYVTENWLSNLLRCLESAPNVGAAVPMSNNVSNLQEYNLGGWKDFAEMQAKAAAFNVSDPSKWEERLRLVSVLWIMKRDVLDNVGKMDFAYVHDFMEDDFAIRMRRMGYKLILCKDTWVCHDHDFRNMEDKDPAQFQASLESGRRFYREKYHGIDAWDDINNYELQLLAPLDTWMLPRGEITALCVDVRCGTPVLEVRNHLKKRGRTDVKSWAFTTQAKYFLDLQTTDAKVECDRIDFIQSHYADETFDIVALGEPLNTYPTPITFLQRLYNFTKRGGILMFKLRNTNDFNALMRSAGLGGNNDGDNPAVMTIDEVGETLKLFGVKNVNINSEQYTLNQKDLNTIKNWLNKINPNHNDQTLLKLLTHDYTFSVVKG